MDVEGNHRHPPRNGAEAPGAAAAPRPGAAAAAASTAGGFAPVKVEPAPAAAADVYAAEYHRDHNVAGLPDPALAVAAAAAPPAPADEQFRHDAHAHHAAVGEGAVLAEAAAYPGHGLAEATAAAAAATAAAGGQPAVLAEVEEASAAAAVAAAVDPYAPPVVDGAPDDDPYARCRLHFEAVSAWPDDGQLVRLSAETGRDVEDLRLWFDAARREAHRMAEERAAEEDERRLRAEAEAAARAEAEAERHQAEAQQAVHGEVPYDEAAAAACAAAAAVAAEQSQEAQHGTSPAAADATHAAPAPDAAHGHDPHGFVVQAVALEAATAFSRRAEEAEAEQRAALARSRGAAKSRLQEYRAKCTLFFETVTAWPTTEQLGELAADTGRTVDQLRRWFYQARHHRYKSGEMTKDGRRAAAVEDAEAEAAAAAATGGTAAAGAVTAVAAFARPGVPHVLVCREFFRDVSRYPTPAQMKELSERTGRTAEQLRKWFYKERYELKRKSADRKSVAEGAVAAAGGSGEASGGGEAAAAERFEMDAKEYSKFLQAYLENETAYPTEEAVTELALKTGRAQDTVRRWFYKTRHKVRKEGGDLLGDADTTAGDELRRNFYGSVTKYPNREQIEDLCRMSGRTFDQMRRWFEKQRHRERLAELARREEGGGDDGVGADGKGGGDDAKEGEPAKAAASGDAVGRGDDEHLTPEERAAYLRILRDFFSDVTHWPSDAQISDLVSRTGRTAEQLKRWFYKTRHAEYRRDGLVHGPKPSHPDSAEARRKRADPRREFFDKVAQRPTGEQLAELSRSTGYTEEQLKRYFYKMRYKAKEEAREPGNGKDGGGGEGGEEADNDGPEYPAEAVAALKEVCDIMKKEDGTKKEVTEDGAKQEEADDNADGLTDEQVESLVQKTGLTAERVREWFRRARKRERRPSRKDGSGGARNPPEAVRTFEEYYDRVTKYPAGEALDELAAQTGRSVARVRKWFERRRFRDRREGKEAIDGPDWEKKTKLGRPPKRSHESVSKEARDAAEAAAEVAGGSVDSPAPKRGRTSPSGDDSRADAAAKESSGGINSEPATKTKSPHPTDNLVKI